MAELAADLIFEIAATLNPPVVEGHRITAGINGGTVVGEKINGKVLAVGGEFGTFISTNTYRVDVRAAIQTDDGAVIYITYSGFMYSEDPAVLKMLFSPEGKNADPSKYYWRTNPVFETNAPQYDWLNHTVGVGYGTYNTAGEVLYKIYAIQ